MTPFVTIWAGMALVVLILAAWRQFIDLHEDDTIHLGEQQGEVVKEQVTMARKIGTIDHWAKLLALATVAYGVALGGYYLYEQWVDSSKLLG